MEETDNPNYYGIMPAAVRYDENLSASSKVFYAEISALANVKGICWASNKYFARLFKVQPTRISEWVRQLEVAGHIRTKKITNDSGTYRGISVVTPPSGKAEAPLLEKQKHNNKTNNTLSVELKTSLLALVNEITGRQFRTLPEKGVKKTLDAFSLDEIRTALTALAHDPWHKPKLKELSIDYFIRSTTIDRFMGVVSTLGGKPTSDAYGFKNGKKVFTEDEDGKQYWGGELITPQNQAQVLKERNEQ